MPLYEVPKSSVITKLLPIETLRKKLFISPHVLHHVPMEYNCQSAIIVERSWNFKWKKKDKKSTCDEIANTYTPCWQCVAVAKCVL